MARKDKSLAGLVAQRKRAMQALAVKATDERRSAHARRDAQARLADLTREWMAMRELLNS